MAKIETELRKQRATEAKRRIFRARTRRSRARVPASRERAGADQIETELQKQRATKAKRRIFLALALAEWQDDDGDRIVNHIDRCHALTDKLFDLLNGEGLLTLDDDD